MTKTARGQAKQIRTMRDGGATWAEVVEAVGVSETTARKRLKELDEELASSEGKAAKVEPPKSKINTRQDTVDAMSAILDGSATTDDSEVAPKPKKAEETDTPKPRSGRYLKLTCGCGHIIRTSKTVAAAASVKCTDCKKPFTEAA